MGRDPLEIIAGNTAERIRQKLAPKLDDGDIAVIREGIFEDLSQLREAMQSMGYSIVQTGPSDPTRP